jgi:hypothetical protein
MKTEKIEDFLKRGGKINVITPEIAKKAFEEREKTLDKQNKIMRNNEVKRTKNK